MYVHCIKCHHEWECTSEDNRICDWCGGDFYNLEETPLTGINDIILNLKNLNNPFADKIIEKIKKYPKK